MLQIDIFVLLAQILNFGILYFLFRKYIAQGLSEKIEERKQYLEKLENADAHYAEKMKQADEQGEKIVNDAREKGRSIIEDSENIAKANAETIMKKAQDDATAYLEGGKRELEKEKLSMMGAMKDQVLSLSLKLHEKMFSSTSDSSKKFLEAEIGKI